MTNRQNQDVAHREGPPADEDATRMTLGEHLEELRKRIIRACLGLAAGMAVAGAFGRDILAILQRPYVQVMRRLDMDPYLIALEPSAAFTTYFRVVLLTGLILSSPWIFYQLWQFVAAGLYKPERRLVMRAVPFSAALFVAGAVFFLLAAAGPTLLFLMGFSKWVGIRPSITQDNYISFITMTMGIFGLTFQLPLAVLILAKVGLLSLHKLNHYRRHVIVVLLIIAAVVTPSPSPVDQIVLALPMWMLYELGVLLVYLLVRPRKGSASRPMESSEGEGE